MWRMSMCQAVRSVGAELEAFCRSCGVRFGEKPSGNVSAWELCLVQDQKYETQACRFFLFFCSYVPAIGSACAGTFLALVYAAGVLQAWIKAGGSGGSEGLRVSVVPWCGWGWEGSDGVVFLFPAGFKNEIVICRKYYERPFGNYCFCTSLELANVDVKNSACSSIL